MFEKLFESIYDFSQKERPAYRFAKRKHDDTGIIRKHSGNPYWEHPEGVAKIAKGFGLSDNEIIAAFLHDTVEDAGVELDDIKEKFGDEVAEIISEITNNNLEIRRLGKESYMNKELLNLSNPALNVKLCDFYYNMADFPNEQQKQRMKANLMFLRKNRKLTAVQRDLLDACLNTTN